MRPIRTALLTPLAMLALFLASGCASEPKSDVTFTPTEHRRVGEQGQTGATYLLPVATDARGNVNLQYQGIKDARTAKSDSAVPSLHLQMKVDNEKAPGAWFVDVRKQELRLQEQTKSMMPTWAHTEGGSLPLVRVDPGQSQTIDLYFALPPDQQKAHEIPGFVLSWQVRTDQRLVSEATPFDQVTTLPAKTAVYPFENRDFPQTYGPTWRSPAMVGVPSTWWMDPFTDLPYPWHDLQY